MQIELIHFDEVFDVQAGHGDFSFRTAGRSCYGVNFGRKIIPRPGSTFAVAFDTPGDWSTLLAWRDLASSEVRFKTPGSVAVLLSMIDLVVFGPLLIIAGLVIAGQWIAACAFVLLLVFAVSWTVARALRRKREIEHALRAAG